MVDRDGNALSLINSVFQGFGSGILAPESGVLLHNRGLSFRTEAGHPNSVGPGKRPMHTIIPGMLMKDGQAVAPFGVMGGHYQAMGHVELLSGILDRGLDVQAALDAPRSFAYGGSLELEGGISDAAMAGLIARGHPAIRAPLPLGGGQIIWIDRAAGTLVAGSTRARTGRRWGIEGRASHVRGRKGSLSEADTRLSLPLCGGGRRAWGWPWSSSAAMCEHRSPHGRGGHVAARMDRCVSTGAPPCQDERRSQNINRCPRPLRRRHRPAGPGRPP